jgi:hypothetical protein
MCYACLLQYPIFIMVFPFILRSLYLANILAGDKYVPGTQISVDKALAGKVLHAQGHLLGVRQQQVWCVGGDDTAETCMDNA